MVGCKSRHAPLRGHIEVPCSIQEAGLLRLEQHDAHDVCRMTVHGVHDVHGGAHGLPVLRGVTHPRDGSSQAGVPVQNEHGMVAAIAHVEIP